MKEQLTNTCSKCKHFVIQDYQHQHCGITNLPVDFADTCTAFEEPEQTEEKKASSALNAKKVISIGFILYILFKIIKISGVFHHDTKPQAMDLAEFNKNLMFIIENKQHRVGDNNKEIVKSYFTQDKTFSKPYFENEMKTSYNYHVPDSLLKYDTLFLRHDLFYAPSRNDSAYTSLYSLKGMAVKYHTYMVFKGQD